jgi:uncharacterized protein YwqG
MGLFDFFKKKEEQSNSGTPSPADLLEKIEIVPGVMLPKALAAHWNEIEKTRLPFIAIKATPGAPQDVHESTFGYYPCLPKGFTYPTDAKGAFMYPLAQINCNHLPPLDNFPREGYLQFYIAANDVYGLNFDNQQDQSGFRILYFTNEEVKDYQTHFSFLTDVMNYEYPRYISPTHWHLHLRKNILGCRMLDTRTTAPLTSKRRRISTHQLQKN